MISLLPYQRPSAENLFRSLRAHGLGIDASDTGTGKTYISAWVAYQAGFQVLVICPKTLIPVWRRVLVEAEIPAFRVVNYELLRAGSTRYGYWDAKVWRWKLPLKTLLIFDEAHCCKGKDTLNARILRAAKAYPTLALSATLAESPIEMRAIGFLLGLHNWTNWYKWCLANGCWKGAFGGLQFKKKTSDQHLLRLHNAIFPEYGSRIRIADLGDAFPET